MVININQDELLSANQWELMIEILGIFGFNIYNYKRNSKNQLFIWYSLIKIKEKFQIEIRDVLLKNINLCHQLKQQNQIKIVNTKLLRLNYLFSHNFYRHNYNSFNGLTNFLKLFNIAYANPARFQQNMILILNLFDFMNRKFDKLLIREFNYINRISLPVRGYENLRKGLLKVIEKTDHLNNLIYYPAIFNDFMTDLLKFKKLYIMFYLREHNLYQQKLKNFYNQLYLLPEYRNISEKNNTAQKKFIDNFFPDKCQEENPEELIKKETECSCGFRPGNFNSVPSIKKILPILKKEFTEKEKY